MCLWLHEKNLLSDELLNHERLLSIYHVLRKIEEQEFYIGDEFRAYKEAFLSHPHIDSLCDIVDILLKRDLLNNVTLFDSTL